MVARYKNKTEGHINTEDIMANFDAAVELGHKMLLAGLYDIETAAISEGTVDMDEEVPGIGLTRRDIIRHAINLVHDAKKALKALDYLADPNTPNL